MCDCYPRGTCRCAEGARSSKACAIRHALAPWMHTYSCPIQQASADLVEALALLCARLYVTPMEGRASTMRLANRHASKFCRFYAVVIFIRRCGRLDGAHALQTHQLTLRKLNRSARRACAAATIWIHTCIGQESSSASLLGCGACKCLRAASRGKHLGSAFLQACSASTRASCG